MLRDAAPRAEAVEFQCSSASRKFLNNYYRVRLLENTQRFQCSSASRKFLNLRPRDERFCGRVQVSVLFSEPKIPQFLDAVDFGVPQRRVSVLFSEPKIPQYKTAQSNIAPEEFQCSSASRKFLNLDIGIMTTGLLSSFSALQRAENSSICGRMRVIKVAR